MNDDNKNGREISCAACSGHGIVDAWYHMPEECADCNGSGRNWRYNSGLIAKYYSGPLLGHDIVTVIGGDA